jgi:hypothetical protein
MEIAAYEVVQRKVVHVRPSVRLSVRRSVGRPHKYLFLSFFLFKIGRKFRPQEGKHGLQHSISTQSMCLSAYPAK